MRPIRQHAPALAATLVLVITLGAVALGSDATGPVPGTSRVAYAGHGLSHATIKIWNPNATSPSFGFDPNMTVADTGGVTVHVATPANPLTIVTVYENTVCSGHPCGVTYWNPTTNVFKLHVRSFSGR